MKWYIEYKACDKFGYVGGIEAPTGNDAIEVLKTRMVIGVNKICGVWHDDEEEDK